MMRNPPYILIDDCTKEQMYEVLSALIEDIRALKDKELSVNDLRKLYRLMLARQLRDWKAGKEYRP